MDHCLLRAWRFCKHRHALLVRHSSHSSLAASSNIGELISANYAQEPAGVLQDLDSIETREKDGRYAHYELLSCKPVDAYCRIKKNQNQVRLLRVGHDVGRARVQGDIC